MTRTVAHWVRYWGPLALYAGTIYYLSSLSHPPMPPFHFAHLDKVLHLIEYSGLGLLLCRGLARGGRGMPARRAVLIAALLGAFYGALDEFHQAFVPGRDADVFDWMTDVVGSTLGAVFYWFVALRSRSVRPAAAGSTPAPAERAAGG